MEITHVIKGRRPKPLFWISTAFCGSLFMSAHAQKPSLAQTLNWQPRSDNICYGVFVDPHEVFTTGPIKKVNQSPMNITSEKPTTLSLAGQSTLSGNVTIQQPGRLLLANEATFNRDPISQSIDRIELHGNVRYFEHKQELAGERVLITPDRQEVNLWDGAYRMNRTENPTSNLQHLPTLLYATVATARKPIGSSQRQRCWRR
jgi:lipopolysaccharide assembly outer membrane protein LptD (OstA)